ncbi:hypothetical protein LC605_22235 [Nostoc sp. CHAB 5836]|uniref:hypothetical protein n=1 Tax=Nostoc sp. CHAB 5836 TaxID=2780404 RepID=UPI001E382C5D|nr:hypothetical protein [Nostoc sp. CHAB 5836]MCC5617759.1 hypothetical protein [Nostoc sp. CHAB 5836]
MNLDGDSNPTQIDAAELKIEQGIQTPAPDRHEKSEETRPTSVFPLPSDFVE